MATTAAFMRRGVRMCQFHARPAAPLWRVASAVAPQPPCVRVRRLHVAPPRWAGDDGEGQKEERNERIERLKRERDFMRSRLYKSGFSDHIQVQGEEHGKEFVADATLTTPGDPTPRDGAMVLVKAGAGKNGRQFTMGDAVGGGAPTLLTASFKMYGRAQALEWQQGLYDAGLVHDAPADVIDDGAIPIPPAGTFRVVDMNIVEGWVLRLVRGLLYRGLVQASPPWLANGVVAHLTTHSEVLCGELNVHNRLLGYAYLLDGHGRVRWRAHGSPTADEIKAMAEAARAILDGK